MCKSVDHTSSDFLWDTKTARFSLPQLILCVFVRGAGELCLTGFRFVGATTTTGQYAKEALPPGLEANLPLGELVRKSGARLISELTSTTHQQTSFI
jgi:hypothetical protein